MISAKQIFLVVNYLPLAKIFSFEKARITNICWHLLPLEGSLRNRQEYFPSPLFRKISFPSFFVRKEKVLSSSWDGWKSQHEKEKIWKAGKLMATPKRERGWSVVVVKNVFYHHKFPNDVKRGWTERDKSICFTTEKIFLSLCLWRFSVSQDRLFHPRFFRAIFTRQIKSRGKFFSVDFYFWKNTKSRKACLG